MFKLFKYQLKSSFKSLSFIFAFGAVMLLCLYNTFKVVMAFKGGYSMMLPSSASTFILRQVTPGSSLLEFLFIFLIVFPFGFSVYKISRLNYDPVLIARNNRRNYAVSSALTAFTSAFLCFFIPLMISMIVDLCIFPFNGAELTGASLHTYNHAANITGDNIFANTVSVGEPLTYLYINNPHLYNIIYAFMFSFFCGLLSLLVYSLALFIRRLPIFLFLPAYLLSYVQKKVDVLLLNNSAETPYRNVIMSHYIMINTFYGKDFVYFTILCIAILLISLVLIYINYRLEINGSFNFKNKRIRIKFPFSAEE